MTVDRTTQLTNLTWQWASDAELVRATTQGADVACYVEARTRANQPITVQRILPRSLWQVAQRIRTAALAGCALAVRRSSPVRLARWQSVKAAAAGPGVQQRNMLHAVLIERLPAVDGVQVVYEDHLILIHNPLEHTGRQDDAVHAVRARRIRVQMRARTVRAKVHTRVRRAVGRPVVRRVVRWMVLGDFNRSHDSECRALAGVGSGGHDVLGAVWGNDWGDVRVTSEPIAHSDHYKITIKEHR